MYLGPDQAPDQAPDLTPYLWQIIKKKRWKNINPLKSYAYI